MSKKPIKCNDQHDCSGYDDGKDIKDIYGTNHKDGSFGARFFTTKPQQTEEARNPSNDNTIEVQIGLAKSKF